jgi:thiol-disulfide isomerase/thioredoxin
LGKTWKRLNGLFSQPGGSRSEVVLVYFFASWCAHYKKLTLILKKATSLLKGVRKELMVMPCSLLAGDRRQTQVKFFHFFCSREVFPGCFLLLDIVAILIDMQAE